ncbi:MAG: BON domain-containing protein [Pyrinomonadaceae bacterium]
MAERETEHRRIVVETPTTRREVERTEAVHHPERSGMSGAALAAIVVGVIALATLIILFMMNQQQTANETAATQQQPTTTIVQQPAAQQPPVIIEQQAPATQPPVIINNPAAGGSAPATGNGDSAVQQAVDKKLREDPTFSGLGITATVLDGKVTLTGIVQNQALKAQVERAIKNIKGVAAVDNQISVG